MIVAFIDEHKHHWGTEPICRVLSENTEVNMIPSTYYAFIGREPSTRARRDAVFKEHIMRIHAHPRMRAYEIRKIHAQLARKRHEVARCIIERLCRELGIRGTMRGNGRAQRSRHRQSIDPVTSPNGGSRPRRRTN